jgi:hypothetical protein
MIYKSIEAQRPFDKISPENDPRQLSKEQSSSHFKPIQNQQSLNLSQALKKLSRDHSNKNMQSNEERLYQTNSQSSVTDLLKKIRQASDSIKRTNSSGE